MSGLILGIKTVVSPEIGWETLLPAFAAAILGGIGSPVGAVVAAQFSSSLDDELEGHSLAAAEQSRVDDAKRTPIEGGSDADGRVLADARTDASVDAFRLGMLASGLLVMAGGVISAVGIQNPRREVKASECAGGAICGASEDLGRAPPPGRGEAEPVPA